MNDTTASILRSLPKVIGSVLVTMGMMSMNDANALLPVIEAAIGAISLAVGYWMSHKAHK